MLQFSKNPKRTPRRKDEYKNIYLYVYVFLLVVFPSNLRYISLCREKSTSTKIIV